MSVVPWPEGACGFCSNSSMGVHVFHGFPCNSAAARQYLFEQLPHDRQLAELHRQIDGLQTQVRSLSFGSSATRFDTPENSDEG